MNYFIDYLNQIVPLPEKSASAINEITVRRKLSLHTSLLRNGDVCREFHFIEKGIARVFYYKDGKEVTAWFAAENQIVSAIDSLFTGQPSLYNIEILEDSTVWSLQYNKIEPVFQGHPIVERLGRLLITKNYLLLDERMKLFAFCTAEERYERLLLQIPDILQRVKLGQIASYLGISQEHLSRIRGRK
ncbi:cAMP-binding domain of CRP or a regulatory subunit of cAMP-dependent protein kinases [Dyadobacter koreensis]|uniref:cAMP-binding domain of CRP or a regulatory subunit of cAMP-dependent protein kinases n=1 Tax=Dyadobacter koreensis TaxID=408657 RepID=A0A1H6TLG0_9BACT|nr:Crp/Fnr family transcriptional regulator [Dyadobacter koreensis]SEI80811.1 cAMP-binding domain of CRP or a regulatory subunit of cAMP-dependent protein kinases [Dyadobacter koreensis]